MSIVHVATLSLNAIWPSILVIEHVIDLSWFNGVVIEQVFCSICVNDGSVIVISCIVSQIINFTILAFHVFDVSIWRIVSCHVLWVSSVIIPDKVDTITILVIDLAREVSCTCVCNVFPIVEVNFVENAA
jgi:hypothetical protein